MMFAVSIVLVTSNISGQINDVSAIVQSMKAAGKTGCDDVITALEDSGTPAPAAKLPLSNFGVGIGGVVNIGDDRIADAAVVNGKIVILSDENLTLGPVLEAHALSFTIDNVWAVKDSKGQTYVTNTKPCDAAGEFPTIAHGPFVVTRVGDNEIVKSLGVGWMFGFRIRQTDTSLNVGLAYTLETNVKRLADGFEEGNALPTGESAIRFRTGRGTAVALVVSFGF
jgi:hypothetical protein